MSEAVKCYYATDVPVVWDGTGVGRVPEVVLLSDYKRAMAEKDAELNLIDEALAWRPALAYCPTRYDKIMRACTMAGRAEKTEAALASLKARCEGMREACQALMDYEKVMDGADGCGENDELYWKAVRFARAALTSLPVEGLVEQVAEELFIIANEWEGEDVTHGDWVLMVKSAKQGYRKAASCLIRVIGSTP